ncbi:phosphate ABC transporter substrate-binding protein PstS [Ideonella sp. DXS22W]|uniref:Phosphate-binding protein PstS n=1 Tax=Pseudaquabacterium inlustre TaxID=2984192 RepID=A0ABU9CFY9_9BURK
MSSLKFPIPPGAGAGLSVAPPASAARRQWLRAAGVLAWPSATWAAPASSPATATGAAVQGAGASFPARLYRRWAQDYAQATGAQVNYQPTGSGDGVKQAIARTVAFGGTDTPLAPEALARHGLMQLPTAVGGIVPVVHGAIEAHRLRLSGELLAEIFSGAVERWDDPRIAALNRGLSLPARRIVRVVRAEKSGSTEAFSRYLAERSPAFAEKVGASALPAWPGEVQAAEGNDGVAAAVRATPGAIGYVGHDRVEAGGVSPVQLRNRDGAWVSAGVGGFRTAVLHSDLHRQGQDLASLIDRPGPDSWPLTLTSFVLIDAVPARAQAVEWPLRFWYWCFMRGDAATQGTGFAPLPVSLQARLAARFAAVRGADGLRPRYQGA